MNRIGCAAFCLFFLLASSGRLLAWDSGETHPRITEEAIEKKSGLDRFLKEELKWAGFEMGIQASIADPDSGLTYKVVKWAQDGSTHEDDGHLNARAWNHFHDPTAPSWDSAGLKGSWLGLSSVLWSQKPDQDSGACCGDYSWPDVRGYYFQAFTEADETERRRNLVALFRGIGQLMHLVQDMAVPLHTRNDIHLFGRGRGIEGWAEDEFHRDWALAQPYTGPSLENIFSAYVDDTAAPTPVSALWDMKRYDGEGPPLGSGLLGLAEYASYNFLSWHTVGAYKYPLDTALNHALGLYEEVDGSLYLQKPATAFGSHIYHLANVTSLAHLYLPDELLGLQVPPYLLDDNCFEEYSGLLLPFATEYSAKLVDYFFRGRMSVRAVPLGEESYGVQIRNDTEGETMKGGTLTIGRLCPGPDGDICQTAGQLVTMTVSMGSVEPGTWSEPFPISDSLIDSTDDLNDRYYYVYRGGLGDEDGSEITRKAVVVHASDPPPMVETWSPSEGMVFRGSSGSIQGDLGIWKYKSAEYPSHPSCDPRIEISNGVLTVHECHGRECTGGMGCPEYFGEGSFRIWLDDFNGFQERIPLEELTWNCEPATGDLGDAGHSECYLGLKEAGLRDDNPATVTDDQMCLRGLDGGGSLYFGAGLRNNSVADTTNESTMSLSGIVLTAAEEPDPYPPRDAVELTETWRGITGDFRPLITTVLYDEGEVRIPGDLGTWVFVANGTQINGGVEPNHCDTRVHIEDGVATIYECHHKIELAGDWSFANWRLYLAEPYGDLTATPLSSLAWTAAAGGDFGGGGYATSALGLKNQGLTELGALSGRNLSFSPPDKLKVLSDSYGPLAVRFGLHTDAVGESEIYETTATLEGMVLTIFDPEEGEPAPGPGSTRLAQRLATPQDAAPQVPEKPRELEAESVMSKDMMDFSRF